MVSHAHDTHVAVQEVLDGIRRIVQGLRESSRASHRRTGLSAAQMFVLRRLAEVAPLSVNELAAATYTHQSSVSVVVSKLVARRLIARIRDPRDARRRLLVLTPAGTRALAASPGATQEHLIRAIETLPPASRRTTARALASIADALSARARPEMFFEGRSRR